jgi:hypothetical protein
MKLLKGSLTALLLTVTVNAMAADAKMLLIDAAPCLTLQNAAEKLACFEKQVTAAQGSVAVNPPAAKAEVVRQSPPPPPPVVKASEPVRVAVVESVGIPGNFGLKQDNKSEQPKDELTSTIVSLKATVPNKYQITLQNGQVWRQVHAQRYALVTGQEVHIAQGGWGGSYRLAVAKLGGFIEVERVK